MARIGKGPSAAGPGVAGERYPYPSQSLDRPGSVPVRGGGGLTTAPPVIGAEEAVGIPTFVATLNAEWRSTAAEQFRGSDKAAIARWLGVTRRTVERWVTLAGERRNPFPARLQQVPLSEWPEWAQRRLMTTVQLFWGTRSPLAVNGEPRAFTESFCDAHEFLRFCLAVAGGTYDAWLTGQWISMHWLGIEADGVWRLEVIYGYEKLNYRKAKAQNLPRDTGTLAYPSPPPPIIPDEGPYEGNLLSPPVPGFDYAAGEYTGGTVR